MSSDKVMEISYANLCLLCDAPVCEVRLIGMRLDRHVHLCASVCWLVVTATMRVAMTTECVKVLSTRRLLAATVKLFVVHIQPLP